MKNSGMRWGPDGGQVILNLRGWCQSGRFDRIWILLAAAYKTKVDVIAEIISRKVVESTQDETYTQCVCTRPLNVCEQAKVRRMNRWYLHPLFASMAIWSTGCDNAADLPDSPVFMAERDAATELGIVPIDAGTALADDAAANQPVVSIDAAVDASIALNAAPDTATTARLIAVVIDVLANDQGVTEGNAFVKSFTAAANGVVRSTPDGRLEYRPHSGFDGMDSFAYVVLSDSGAESRATVTVTVAPKTATVVAGVAYLATETRSPIDPERFGGMFFGANNKGQHIGRTEPDDQAFVQAADGEFIFVAPPTGQNMVLFEHINDDGAVVGNIFDVDYNSYAFLWKDGSFVKEWTHAGAFGINNAGQVVGTDFRDGAKAYLWKIDGTDQPVEIIIPGATEVDARGISNNGTIVGHAKFLDSPNTTQCFLRDKDGKITRPLIPAEFKTLNFFCSRLNNSNVIVGSMEAQDYSFNYPFVWSEAKGFSKFYFPQVPPPGSYGRGASLTAITDTGLVSGYYFERTPYIDAEDGDKRKYKMRFHAIDFAPLNAAPNTSFEDTRFD